MEIDRVLKKKNYLCVDFNHEFIKIIYAQARDEGLGLLAYDLKDIAVGQDNKVEIINFITNFLKNNSIAQKEVYFSISEPESVVIKQLTLPLLPRNELAQAIKWQLKDQAPFDLNSAILDWQIVKTYADEEGAQKNEIVCILAKPETISKYLSIINECRLLPLAISSNPFNYAYVLDALAARPAPVICILDIGWQHATLCIYKESKLLFVRDLAVSSNRIIQSLSGTLISDKGRIELSPEKAKELIMEFGIPRDETVILKDNIQAMHVISLIRPVLENLVKEIQRSFDYFSSTSKEEKPGAIYITGAGADLKNLDWYLNKELKVAISRLPIPFSINTVRIDKERLNKDYSRLMGALGFILAGDRAINLLPQEIKEQKKDLTQKSLLRVVSIAIGAVLLFSFFAVKLRIADYGKRLKYAHMHLANIGDIRDIKHKVDIKKELIARLQRGSVPVDSLLRTIGALIPHNVIINELDLDQRTNILTLKGSVSQAQESAEVILTRLMEKLEATSFFNECTLTASRESGSTNEFQINCDLAY